MYIKLFLVCLLYLASLAFTEGCKGCLSLDEYNINKILPRFKAVLIKFDVAYPYGEKQEAFEKVAADIASSKDIILAQIGIKDYGDRDNEELGKKYGITNKDQLPQIKLFLQNKDEPIDFPKEKDWSADGIRSFIRENTDIYIGLSGCLEEFDKLAVSFMTASDKDAKLKEAQKAAEKLKEEEKSIAETYIKFMKKVIESGKSFINQEITRLNKILKGGRMNDKKKKELSDRVNILRAFSIPKDEL